MTVGENKVLTPSPPQKKIVMICVRKGCSIFPSGDTFGKNDKSSYLPHHHAINVYCSNIHTWDLSFDL